MADIAAVTRIDITATDSTQAAAASVQSSLNKLGALGASITSQFEAMAAALGVGLSVGGLVEFSKGVISAAEDLHKLAVVTGSSVEDLSRLSNAARISGTDFETFRNLTEKLASQMQGIGTESTKAQKALQFLGVSAKDPAQALQQVAETFDRFADGAGKAAAARDLFGRGGPEIIAALHGMAVAGNELITTTTADAEAAAHLAEQVRTLQVQMTGLKDAVLRDAVPALSSWITNIQLARQGGLGFWDSLKFGTTFADRMNVVLETETKKLQELKDAYDQAGKSGREFAQRDTLGPDVAQQQKVVDALRKMAGFNPASSANPQSVYGDAWSTKPVLGYASAVAAAKTPLESLTESLVDQYAKLHLTNTEYQIWQANLKGAKGTLDELIISNREISDRIKDSAFQLKAQADGFAANDAAQKKLDDEATKYTDSLRDLNKELQLENDTFGFSADAIQIHTLSLQRDAAVAAQEADNILLIDAALEKVGIRAGKTNLAEGAKAAADEFKHTADAIDHDFAGMWGDLIFNGKNAFTGIANYAKQLFDKLILQPILQPIANSLAGSVTAGGSASGSFGFGGIGNIGSLFSGGAFSSAAGAGFSAGVETLGIAATAGVEAIGGMTAALGAFAAVAGPVGAALTAGYLAYTLLAPKAGGPKSGGSAQSGDVSMWSSMDTAGGTRYFTPSTADADLKKIVDASKAGYAQALKGLGGTSAAAQFALGYDVDPHGTAASRVAAGVKIGGQTVYQSAASVAHGDDAGLQAAVALEAQRSILAALQASDLPADIARILKSIDAATATADAVTNIETLAEAMKLFDDALGGNAMADALKSIADASDPAFNALQRQADALAALGDAYTGTTEQSQALQSATSSYYQSLVAELATIENLKTTIGKSDADVKRGLTLQTLSGTSKYGFYQSDAAAAEAKLAGATTPADVKALHDQILGDIQSAFGLLTPDQQLSQLAQFTAGVDRIDQEATARLTSLEDTLQANENAVLDKLSSMLADAAAKMQSAGDTMLEAAGTPVAVTVSTPSAAPTRARHTNF